MRQTIVQPAAFLLAAFFLAGVLVAPALLAQETVFHRDSSVFAVVTHKAGVAAKLAHNHLVVATDYTLDGNFDPAEPTATRLTLDASVQGLVVDDAAQHQAWQDRIIALEILGEPFGELKDSDRKKIRKSMLSKGQLNVEKHPRLSAEIVGITDSGSGDFPYRVRLKVDIVGQSVETELTGRVESSAGGHVLEAYGELKFTDFGIKPYSAMLGAVRNDDPFHLFVHLVFRPTAEAEAPDSTPRP